jgi:Raf kinase inhibitor-like YbhB/YbcL family protein
MIQLMMAFAFWMQASLTITSPDFKANEPIPSEFTCEGENSSPALRVDGIPAGTKSLALIVHDPDAPIKGGVTHWVAWNISPTAIITRGSKDGVQGQNTAHKAGYMGPCPPTGTHHYHFYVFALDTQLKLDESSGEEALQSAMKSHILAKGELIGLYKKLKS